MDTNTTATERIIKRIAGFPPGIPLILVLACILICCVPALTTLLQYDIRAIAHGEVWRLLTGHFTHWNFEHLFWDVTMFATFGIWCYRDNKKAYYAMLLAIPLLTSLATMCLCPNMHFYRGLSGIDTGLFAYTAIAIMKKAKSEHSRTILSISALMLILLTGKTIFELCTGTTLFVTPEGFVAAPLAHLAGIITGTAVATASLLKQNFSGDTGLTCPPRIVTAERDDVGPAVLPRTTRLGES